MSANIFHNLVKRCFEAQLRRILKIEFAKHWPRDILFSFPTFLTKVPVEHWKSFSGYLNNKKLSWAHVGHLGGLSGKKKKLGLSGRCCVCIYVYMYICLYIYICYVNLCNTYSSHWSIHMHDHQIKHFGQHGSRFSELALGKKRGRFGPLSQHALSL